jgi:predicted Zn-dependent protease
MKNFLIFLIAGLLIAGCNKSKDDYVNNPGASDFHNRVIGASANEILSASKYTSLKIEIQYMTGYPPDAGALTHLQNTLAVLVNKPSGITIVTKEIPASTKTALSVNDIIDIEKNNRTAFTNGSELAICVLYTNGTYSDPNVLGVAYKNTSAAIFGKTIYDNSGGFGQASRTKLEATVLEHELGHLLGLVDIGSPMQSNHKDAAHGSHCNNTNCLMYYASETRDILGILITGNIPAFDANCRADMQANGGK